METEEIPTGLLRRDHYVNHGFSYAHESHPYCAAITTKVGNAEVTWRRFFGTMAKAFEWASEHASGDETTNVRKVIT